VNRGKDRAGLRDLCRADLQRRIASFPQGDRQ
jgi:hypothetical protein